MGCIGFLLAVIIKYIPLQQGLRQITNVGRR